MASNDAAAYLFGQTEIEDFDQTVSSDDDIRRLQIAMNDAAVMSARECAGNLNAIPQQLTLAAAPHLRTSHAETCPRPVPSR